MILSKLAVMTLVVSAATGIVGEPPAQVSLQQKDAAIRAYMRVATECVAHTVAADTRFHRDDPAANLGDLIVDAMPNCVNPVRAMIDAHDRQFGEGSGEQFFMGAYLDFLPTAILNSIKNAGN
jgi:hypothetical protein